MDNTSPRVSFPAMRASGHTLALSIALLLGAGCPPDTNKESDILKAPETWNVKADELTFGAKNLDAFNTMSTEERDAHLEALAGQPGAFKGQARFQRLTELGEAIDDREYGQFEAYATVEEPVLYEITIEYHLFAPEKLGDGFPPGAYIEFTGTLADLVYSADAKPRKLEIKVKDVTITRLDG
jgi:hypothetical protein